MFRRGRSAIVGSRMIPAYSRLPLLANDTVMSPVMGLPSGALLGTIDFRVHVRPPSTDVKIGAKLPPLGSAVNAEAAICRGFAGLTVTVGSLSCSSSKLIERGIMFTTSTALAAFTAASFFARGDFFAAREDLAVFLAVLVGMWLLSRVRDRPNGSSL